MLVDDEGADLHVRAWRFSYNARGIIEMPNRLRAAETAVIMVHPWGIDDGQGWKTPEPAGVCDFCTPAKNHLAARHTREVINPFLKSLRGKVGLRHVQPARHRGPDPQEALPLVRPQPDRRRSAQQGAKELKEKLASLPLQGEPLPATLTLSADTPVVDYFRQFPGLDAGPRYNGAGLLGRCRSRSRRTSTSTPTTWSSTTREGYPPLRDFLKKNKVRHVLLAGYATDMCYCRTTAGYENLSKDFNVFLVGDATPGDLPEQRHARGSPPTPPSRSPPSTS